MGTGVLAAKALDEQRRFDISSQLGELNMALADFNENLQRAAANNPASDRLSGRWSRNSAS
jgi:hypothetical protein